MSLTEKTLELNLIHEFLTQCRSVYPKAFAAGTTLTQEGRRGYDSRVLGTLDPRWKAAVFQFKRAIDHFGSGAAETFVFEINNNGKKDQHSLLWRISGGNPNVAIYVLPLVDSHRLLRNYVPDLRVHAGYIDAADIRFLG